MFFRDRNGEFQDGYFDYHWLPLAQSCGQVIQFIGIYHSQAGLMVLVFLSIQGHLKLKSLMKSQMQIIMLVTIDGSPGLLWALQNFGFTSKENGIVRRFLFVFNIIQMANETMALVCLKNKDNCSQTSVAYELGEKNISRPLNINYNAEMMPNFFLFLQYQVNQRTCIPPE